MPTEARTPEETLTVSKKDLPLIDETVTAHLLQIFGNQTQAYMPTQAQVDRILALQEKEMDYAHEERRHLSPRQKIQLFAFFVITVVFLTLFFACLFYAPEYLGEVITGAIAFAAGSAGGYGIAKSKQKQAEE